MSKIRCDEGLTLCFSSEHEGSTNRSEQSASGNATDGGAENVLITGPSTNFRLLDNLLSTFFLKKLWLSIRLITRCAISDMLTLIARVNFVRSCSTNWKFDTQCFVFFCGGLRKIRAETRVVRDSEGTQHEGGAVNSKVPTLVNCLSIESQPIFTHEN